MAQVDVICVDSDGDTEESAVLISDTEEDVIFVFKKEGKEVDMTQHQTLSTIDAQTLDLSQPPRSDIERIADGFGKSEVTNSPKLTQPCSPSPVLFGDLLKSESATDLQTVNDNTLGRSVCDSNILASLSSDSECDTVIDTHIPCKNEQNCDVDDLNTTNEVNKESGIMKCPPSPVIKRSLSWSSPSHSSPESPASYSSVSSAFSPVSFNGTNSVCTASDVCSLAYGSDSDLDLTDVDSSDSLLSSPTSPSLLSPVRPHTISTDSKLVHVSSVSSPKSNKSCQSIHSADSGCKLDNSFSSVEISAATASITDRFSITPAATPMFDRLIHSPHQGSNGTPSQRLNSDCGSDPLKSLLFSCDNSQDPNNQFVSEKRGLASEALKVTCPADLDLWAAADKCPQQASQLFPSDSALSRTTDNERCTSKSTSPCTVVPKSPLKQKITLSESSIPPKKRKINTVDTDSMTLVTAMTLNNEPSLISDDSEDDLEIVELEQSLRVTSASSSFIVEHDECSQCEKVVMIRDLLHCVCNRTCCCRCLEKQVTNLLAKGEKGLPKCGSVDCDLLFQLEKLAGFLPSMVMSILRKKVEEETIGDIMEWLKPQKVEQEKSDVERALELPANWDAMHEYQEYLMITLESDNAEYIEVHNLFHLTMHSPRAQIKSIRRVQNPSLWRFYAMKRYEMNKESPMRRTEQQLFHGTKKEHTDAICRDNFDWRMSGVHGTVYGQGSYFARDSSYSHRYSDPPPCPVASPLPLPPPPLSLVSAAQNLFHRPLNLSTKPTGFPFPSSTLSLPPHLLAALPQPTALSSPTAVSTPLGLLPGPSTSQSNLFFNASQVMSSMSDPMLSHVPESPPERPKHTHCMFLARVLTGRHTAGKSSYRKPPSVDKNCKNAKCYDSCVNSEYSPTIYVVFDKSQCYPEYLIEYTNIPAWQHR